MKGFGNPDYWLVIHYWDNLPDPDRWVPIKGKLKQARLQASRKLADQRIDQIIIVAGSVPKDSLLEEKQFIDIFQGYMFDGAKQYQPPTQKRRKKAIS